MATKILNVSPVILDLINTNTDIVSGGINFREIMLVNGFKFTSNGFVPNGGNPCATTPARIAVDKQDLPTDIWADIVDYAFTTINGGINTLWTQFLTVAFLGYAAFKVDYVSNFWNAANGGAGNFVGFRFSPLVPPANGANVFASNLTAGVKTYITYFPTVWAGKTITAGFYDKIGATFVSSNQATIGADGLVTFEFTVPAVTGGDYYTLGYGFTAGDSFYNASAFSFLTGNITAKSLGWANANLVSSGIIPYIGA